MRQSMETGAAEVAFRLTDKDMIASKNSWAFIFLQVKKQVATIKLKCGMSD